MNLNPKIFIIVVVCCSIFSNVAAQQKDYLLFETEYSAGKIVPNYTKIFPSSSVQQALTLSIGKQSADTTNWGRYYRFPETGVSIFASNLGNNKVFGNQFSFLPFIRFKVLNQTKPLYIKLALGVTYFTTHFDSINNIENLSNGSSFTWGFQAMLYKTIYQKENFNLKIVGGYSHHSNGHTQIPNFGLNSALFGISAQWKKDEKVRSGKTEDRSWDPSADGGRQKLETSNSKLPTSDFGLRTSLKKYFINYREGLGFHELGATDIPVGGGKKLVYTSSLSFGLLFNNHIKWKTGFSYRYYEHYYNYIQQNNLAAFKDNPEWSASNIYFFTGVEFLMNHISIDVEGGLNLYKPFYETFNNDFQKDEDVAYQLKKWFNARLGLNYYIANTIKSPTHNVFLGAHINANFGQADFTEFSMGYVYSF